MLIVLASVILLLTAVWVAIQITPVQNWLVHKVTSRLSRDLKAHLAIEHVDFSLFNKMNLQGVLIKDRQQDTILSAGEITVNITDWFFFKKNIELKYIGLKDAYIHLQRSDSVWRHQFLIDYFSGPGEPQKKKSAINLALREIDLKNIWVKQQDGWIGQDMTVSLASLNTVSRKVDFGNKLIDIQSLNINQPYFAILDYKGNRPPRPGNNVPKPVVTDTSTLDVNNNKWKILVHTLALKNGTFRSDNNARPLDPIAFDGRHIEFAKIYGDFKDVKWEMDTVTASLRLSTKERSGFEVKHLIANAKFTPHEMTFEDLDIQTNDSHISNYFSMRYDDFGDMNDFVEKVTMEGRFENTEINSNDIAYFAPDLKTWKKRIRLNGNIKGPVSSLIGKNLDIHAGDNTHFSGDANLTGLPEINNTYLDIKANEFKTVYADAIAFIPPLRKIDNPDLSKLEYVNFKGNFAGFINDFVTFGTLQTALGAVKADVNLKLKDAAYPIYSGTVSTANFNLGPLIKDKNVGYVSLNATLKGAGLNPQRGNVALDARIQYVDYKNYRFRDITLDGELSKKIFDGSVIVNDPNAHLNMHGLVNMSSKTPEFNFMANVDTFNLYNTNLFKENIAFSGRVNAQFSGNTIDDFLGSATITNASLTRNGLPLSFDSLSVSSSVEEDQKRLSIVSNEFSANVYGIFNIRDLPNSALTFLSRYYPSYIKTPNAKVPEQFFNFDIKTHDFSSFATIIDSSLSGLNDSRISGSINTTNNTLSLDVNVPYFKYRQFGFFNTDIDATGTYDSLTLYGSVSDIGITDSLKIPLATFNILAHEDVSQVSITGSGNNKSVDEARLNAVVNTYSNGVGIKFSPSGFMLNGKAWSIEDKGELEFRTNAPAHGLLVLKESTQEIKIETLPSDVGSWNDAAITLKNINIGDIAPYLLPHNRLEGLVDAHVLVENPGKNMKISSEDFIGRGIRLDNDSIGDLGAAVVFDMPTQELRVNGSTLGKEDKSLAYDVKLYLKNRETQADNVIALKPKNFDLKYIDRFLSTLFSDISGNVTGDFQVKGPLDAVTVVGKGRLQNAGLKVKFTQCYYKIQDREIELSENEINLDGIVLEDTITGNPVYLTGSILHNAFDDMFYDITVSTRKPGTRDARNNRPVQVLNTTYADNKLFYGDVKATGSFVLVGSEDNSFMKIDAIATDREESSFTIASANSYADKMPEWLVERKHGVEITDSLIGVAGSQSAMSYELDVTANPKVLMKFVMDDLTGDQIVGRGYGTLNIKAGTNEPLAIKGRLDIEEGTYNYTFKSFFPKPFEIIKGTENYISWTGDPLKANINIQAKYKAERVSFSPLAGINIDQSYANTRENVYVYAALTGELFKPEFKFELQLDPNSRYNNDFNVTNALQQIERSQTEVTRQVTYLIVFNSFAPPQTGVSNIGIGAAVNELTYNTISSLSGLLFNEVNKKLNTALSSLLGQDVRFNFSGSVYNRNVFGVNAGNFNINQANVSGSLLVPFFKDRLVISLGSSLEVPLQSTLQQTVQFLPDVTAEWLLNASGSIRLNLFYRENLDYLTTSSSGAAKTLKRTGGGISFKREFNTLKELFTNARRRSEREANRNATLAADSANRIQPALSDKKDTIAIPHTVPEKEQ